MLPRPLSSPVSQAARVGRATLCSKLPPRYEHYATDWFSESWALASPGLKHGARALGVGSGGRPALPLDRRPIRMTSVGLDVSRSGREATRSGSYDEVVIRELSEFVPALEERFDRIVSGQVVEHVPSLDRALANIYAYLMEGGHAAARATRNGSVSGLVNIQLPPRLGTFLVARSTRRDPVFPAYYDQCHCRGSSASFNPGLRCLS